MRRKLCHFIWVIWWFHKSKDFQAVKAGKSAIWPWLSCQYNVKSSMNRNNQFYQSVNFFKVPILFLFQSSQPNDFSKSYFLGIFVNWRQLAAILLAFAIPYVLGLIMVLPNDMPLPSTRKVRGKLHNGVPIHSPQKLKTSSTEKFFDISEVFYV